jgi:hypothetical protein
MNKTNKSKNSNLVTKSQLRQAIASSRAKGPKRYMLTSTGTITTPVSVTSGGTIYPCDQIAQGSGNQTRIGMDAIVRKIVYRGLFTPDSTDVMDTFRLIIFRWSDSVAPTVSDVLVSTSNLVNSFYDLENYKSNKLQILFDKRFTTATGLGQKVVDVELDANYPIVWNSTSASSALVGSICILVCSDSTAIPSPTLSGAMSIRIEQD